MEIGPINGGIKKMADIVYFSKIGKFYSLFYFQIWFLFRFQNTKNRIHIFKMISESRRFIQITLHNFSMQSPQFIDLWLLRIPGKRFYSKAVPQETPGNFTTLIAGCAGYKNCFVLRHKNVLC